MKAYLCIRKWNRCKQNIPTYWKITKRLQGFLMIKKSTQEEKAAYRKRLQVLKKNPLYNEAIRYKRREDDIRDLRKQSNDWLIS